MTKKPSTGARELKVRVKTARKRSLSSTLWLERQLNDPYVAKAKREGMRSRAAFKLIEIDDKVHFLKKGARVVVSDNGPGMKPSELARALDGTRVSTDGKPDGRRTGLGLPLARQLIEAHGGRLELQSEAGVGTTATIWLP